jgi:ribosomal protein S27AE
MRRAKLCPKCGSGEIAAVPGSVGAFGTGSNIPIGQFIFSAVRVSRYICTACGFIEEWVDNPEDIAKIKGKYGDSNA